MIGHSLAVISSGRVAEHLLASRPDQARQAITAIRGVSKQALTSRAEPAALRGGVRHADRRRTPGLSGVPPASQMRDAGLDVEVDLPKGDYQIPEIVSAAAYRIVQESLTNVARHAGSGATASVRAVLDPNRLELEIVDDGSGTRTPLTEEGELQGMRERVAAVAGAFSAGRRPEGGTPGMGLAASGDDVGVPRGARRRPGSDQSWAACARRR